MDTILKNPGLQHIAEEIFLNLGEYSLRKCANLNQNAMELINRPMFWFKKLSQVKVFSKYIEPWRELIWKLNCKCKKPGLIFTFLLHYFSLSSPQCTGSL